MRIRFTKTFRKRYKKLTAQQTKVVNKAIRLLGQNPTHPSLRSKKIQGTSGEIFECSPNMSIRLTYHYEKPDTIVLRNVGEHDDVLKKP
jgi:mRNA interferase RelE/StbE